MYHGSCVLATNSYSPSGVMFCKYAKCARGLILPHSFDLVPWRWFLYIELLSDSGWIQILEKRSCLAASCLLAASWLLSYSVPLFTYCKLVALFHVFWQRFCEEPARLSMPITIPSQITVDCKSVHWFRITYCGWRFICSQSIMTESSCYNGSISPVINVMNSSVNMVEMVSECNKTPQHAKHDMLR